jgi:hypothetical protein
MLKFNTWPCCPECGCRLEISVIISKGVTGYDDKFGVLRHFGLDPRKDARGCACRKIADTWTADYRQIKAYI